MRWWIGALWKDRLSKPTEFLTMVATILALLFAGTGAIFVYRQILDLRQALDSQAYGVITEHLNELNKRFVEYPEMRPYFRAGKPLPANDSERQRILAIADLYLDFIDNFYAQVHHLDRSHYDLCGWRAFFKRSFERSPVLCAVLCMDQDEYSDAMKHIAAASCKGTTSLQANTACQIKTANLSTADLPDAHCIKP
jgi:hypothetical protein